MPASDPVTASAVLPQVEGMAIGTAVLGTLWLAVVVMMSSSPVPVLRSALTGALIFAVVAWLLGRGRHLRMWARAERANRASLVHPRRAFLRGLMLSLWLSLGQMALLCGFAVLLSFEDVASVAGIVVGFALWQGLLRHDLRRWQRENQLLICQRADGRRIGWSGAQERDRLMTVRSNREPDVATPLEDDAR